MKLRFKPRLTLQSTSIIGLALATIALLTWRLHQLTNGLSPTERPLDSVRSTLNIIWDQPINLVLELTRLTATTILPGDGAIASRLPSVALGLVTAGLLFWLLKQWYGHRLAMFGLVLLVTAPWFLHGSRLATDDITYPLAMTVVLVLAALWHKKNTSPKLLYGTLAAAGLMLYTPGFVWLLLCVIAFEWKNITTTIKKYRLHSFLASLVGLTLLVPLIHMLIINPATYADILGLPGSWQSPLDYLKQFAHAWQYIFIGGYDDPLRNLVGLPLLNVFTTVATGVGVYLYSRHPKATRTRLMLTLWLVGSVLTALGVVAVGIVLPIVFVLAAGGIGYLLHLWLKVFPRNPVARNFGICLLALVVAFSVLYGVRQYYVAWPNSEATLQAFSRQL